MSPRTPGNAKAPVATLQFFRGLPLSICTDHPNANHCMYSSKIESGLWVTRWQRSA
jgi:hypothetical protein